MIIKSFWIGLLLFFSAVFGLRAQETIRFSISVAGINNGEMTAVKSNIAEKERYQLESNVNFWFFGRIKALVTTDATYDQKQFLQSVMHTVTNKGEFVSEIEWKNDRYIIEAESYKYEHKDEIKEAMEYSGIKLFFEEPAGVNKLLNEHYGKVAQVAFINNEYYQVVVAGNTNKYFYENGRLVRAIMEHPIKNYVVKRIN